MKNKKKYITTYNLYNLLKKQENPEKVIIFIYKNIFTLINQINCLDENFYTELSHKYETYYINIIENTEEIWLKTLFIWNFTSCKLSNFYQGLVCRIAFTSDYLHVEPENFRLAHKIDIKPQDKSQDTLDIYHYRYYFTVLKKYNNITFNENIDIKNFLSHNFILYKEGTPIEIDKYAEYISSHQISNKLYSNNKKIILELINKYKNKINKEGNKDKNKLIEKAWSNFCHNMLLAIIEQDYDPQLAFIKENVIHEIKLLNETKKNK